MIQTLTGTVFVSLPIPNEAQQIGNRRRTEEDIVYQVISVQPVGMNARAGVRVPSAEFPQALYVVPWLFTEGLDKIVNY